MPEYESDKVCRPAGRGEVALDQFADAGGEHASAKAVAASKEEHVEEGGEEIVVAHQEILVLFVKDGDEISANPNRSEDQKKKRESVERRELVQDASPKVGIPNNFYHSMHLLSRFLKHTAFLVRGRRLGVLRKRDVPYFSCELRLRAAIADHRGHVGAAHMLGDAAHFCLRYRNQLALGFESLDR